MSWVLLSESWVPAAVEEGFIPALFEGYREAGGRISKTTLDCYLTVRLLTWIQRRIGIDQRPVSEVSTMSDRPLALLRA
jgi:hypothetical protein